MSHHDRIRIWVCIIVPMVRSGLASDALSRSVLRWPLRPKQHQMEHLLLDFGAYSNPRHFSCLLDEDLIGKIKVTCGNVHPSTMSIRSLERYAVSAALLWIGNVEW